MIVNKQKPLAKYVQLYLLLKRAKISILAWKVAMARKKGAIRVPRELCRTIYHMSWVGVGVKAVAKYYAMPQLTVSKVIRR